MPAWAKGLISAAVLLIVAAAAVIGFIQYRKRRQSQHQAEHGAPENMAPNVNYAPVTIHLIETLKRDRRFTDAIAVHTAITSLYNRHLPVLVQAVIDSIPSGTPVPAEDIDGVVNTSPANWPYPPIMTWKFLIRSVIGRSMSRSIFTPIAHTVNLDDPQTKSPILQHLTTDISSSLTSSFRFLANAPTQERTRLNGAVQQFANECWGIVQLLQLENESAVPAKPIFPETGARFDTEVMTALDEDASIEKVVPVLPGLLGNRGEVIFKCQVLGISG